jgi:hypothetical protein
MLFSKLAFLLVSATAFAMPAEEATADVADRPYDHRYDGRGRDWNRDHRDWNRDHRDWNRDHRDYNRDWNRDHRRGQVHQAYFP